MMALKRQTLVVLATLIPALALLAFSVSRSPSGAPYAAALAGQGRGRAPPISARAVRMPTMVTDALTPTGPAAAKLQARRPTTRR